MTTSQKACFGILDKVFPRGENGMREVVPACFECEDKTACLKSALSTKEGLEFRLERSEEGGFKGWIKRWSQKKHLERLKKEKGIQQP